MAARLPIFLNQCH